MLSCRRQGQLYLNSTRSCTCTSHEGILRSPRIQLHSFLTSVLNGGELSTFGYGLSFTSSIKGKVLGSRKLGGPHRRGRGGCYGVEKTILPLPGNETRSGCRLVTLLALTLFLSWNTRSILKLRSIHDQTYYIQPTPIITTSIYATPRLYCHYMLPTNSSLLTKTLLFLRIKLIYNDT